MTVISLVPLIPAKAGTLVFLCSDVDCERGRLNFVGLKKTCNPAFAGTNGEGWV